MLKASILDGPSKLKLLNLRFWDPKTSNLKVLICWGHLSGWLNANSFDFGWPEQVKTFEFEVFGIQVLISWDHLSAWLGAKSFDFG